MKVVIDTNVFVSATLVAQGPSAQIIDAWKQAERYRLIVSPAILEELREVLFYPRIRKISTWTEEEVEQLLEAVERLAVKTPGEPRLQVIRVDPDDDKFLIAAVEGGADYIVSGDPHLKDLGSYEGVEIVSPAAFWGILQKRSSKGATCS